MSGGAPAPGFGVKDRLELVQEVVEYIKDIPLDQPIRITAETWTLDEPIPDMPDNWTRDVTHIGVASGITRH